MQAFFQFAKKYLIDFASLLYIVLFAYAGISKLLDLQNFQVQLGQSPLISFHATWLSIAVPVFELLLCLALAIKPYRMVALYLSFCLMIMFSTYIFFILTVSPYIPCSCGGILEKMGWSEHLAFNLAFVLLAAIATLSGHRAYAIKILLALTAFGVVSVGGLYYFSEYRLSHENPFIRKYDIFALGEPQSIILENTVFYFAGSDEKSIYLGNHSAPLVITELDFALKNKVFHTVHIDNEDFPFRSLETRVAAPYFYVYDGFVPALYRGKIDNWHAFLSTLPPGYFTQLQPIGNHSLSVRGQKKDSGEHQLEKWTVIKNSIIRTNHPELLQKQIDGIFDTDGILSYDVHSGKTIYTYHYRNEFLIMDSTLTLHARWKTIDTISRAALKVVTLRQTGDTKLAAPPVIVNRDATAYGGLIFIQGGLKGKYQDSAVWEQAVPIDVYSQYDGRYLLSFYIYKDGGVSPGHFFANARGFYSLSGKILRYFPYGKPLKKLLKEYQ